MNAQSKRKSFLDFLRNLSGIKRKSVGERKIKGDIMNSRHAAFFAGEEFGA